MDEQAIYLDPPKLRYQGDGRQDEISKQNRIDASKPVIVRKEYGPETDTKSILKRYGVLATQRRQRPEFLELDTDTDLQTALISIQRAQEAFYSLPQKHRDRYPTAEALWKAWNRHEIRDEEPEKNLDKTENTTT